MYSPSTRSTVTPGKFATRWRSPVSALKSVLFPVFGFPTSATRSVRAFGSLDSRLRSGKALTADTERMVRDSGSDWRGDDVHRNGAIQSEARSADIEKNSVTPVYDSDARALEHAKSAE